MKIRDPALGPKDWELCCTYVREMEEKGLRCMNLGSGNLKLGQRIPIDSHGDRPFRNCAFALIPAARGAR
jgi:hypothetical protein